MLEHRFRRNTGTRQARGHEFLMASLLLAVLPLSPMRMFASLELSFSSFDGKSEPAFEDYSSEKSVSRCMGDGGAHDQ